MNNITSLIILSADGAVSSTPQQGGVWGALLQLGMFIPLIAVFYFLLIRPQRKRDKDAQKMRNDLQVGDSIVTAGGIVGIVVSIKDDTLVVETGGDRSKIRIKKWAIQANETVHDTDN